MWIGGRNTGNEKASDEEELKCSLKRKRREKNRCFILNEEWIGSEGMHSDMSSLWYSNFLIHCSFILVSFQHSKNKMSVMETGYK